MFDFWILPIAAFLLLVVSTITFLASRYKRCPSDKILVVYGKVGGRTIGQLYSWRWYSYLATNSGLCIYQFDTNDNQHSPAKSSIIAEYSNKCPIYFYSWYQH